MSRTECSPLDGRMILVLEDEYLQAEDMTQALEQAGARIIGPYPVVSVALEAIHCHPVIDAAVLDVNLRGQQVFPLADILTKRGIPFVFATGYDRKVMPQDYRHAVVLEKPFRIAQLIAALTEIFDRGGTKP